MSIKNLLPTTFEAKVLVGKKTATSINQFKKGAYAHDFNKIVD